MAKDPVCGMEVDESGDAIQSVVSGTTYYFCTPRCRGRFDEAPERYIESGRSHDPQAAGAAGPPTAGSR